jgi:autotransporter-associated beta strand protein
MRAASRNRHGAPFAIAAGVLLASLTNARAGNDTWSGLGTDDNWGTAANWTAGSANQPPASGDALIFSGHTQTTANNNFSGYSFAGLTFSTSAGSFDLTGNPLTTTAAVVDNSSNFEAIQLPMILGSSTNLIQVGSGGSLLLGGVISDGGNAYALNFAGGGLVTLTNASTYTGSTIVSAGTVTLDFNDGGQTNNLISPTSALVLGGGTLNLNAGSNSVFSAQTFASTAINSGDNIISAAPASGTNYPNLVLGAITDTVGGVVEFVGPATTNALLGTFVETATNNTTTSAATGFGGNGTVTGDYATVGLYDWAATVSDPVSGNDIVGGSQVTGFYNEFGTGTVTLSGNVDFSANSSSSHNTDSMTSMRFNTPGGFVWSPVSVVTTGGMLVTPNVGSNNVIVQGTAGELEPSRGGASSTVIWQNNVCGYLIFNVNNYFNNAKSGAGTLVVAGLGAVELNYPGTYTGPTFIDGGAVAYIANSAAGDGALGAVATAAKVTLNGGTILGGANFSLDNSGSNPRPIALGNDGGALAAAAGTTMTVDGIVSGTTPLTIGIPANPNNGNVAGLLAGSACGTNTPVYATGTVVLTGANTASGGTVLATGTLRVGSTAALPTGGLTFNGGTFQWSGSSPDISAQTVTINGVVANLDVAGNTVAVAGPIGNGGNGSVTVVNSGVAGTGGLFLNGGTAYSGGTTVSSGAVLGGAGTLSGNVTWASGSYAALSATAPITVAGTVSLNNPTVRVIGSGLTTGVYPLLTASGIAGGSTVNPVPSGSAVSSGYAGTVSISGNSVILTVTELGVTATWTDALGDQNWSEGGNWTGGIAPHQAGDAATFGSGGVGSPVILNQIETVGGLTFANVSSYTINGANTLTIDNAGHPAAINVTGGTANAINTPIALNGNLTTTVNAGAALAFGGSVANASTSPEALTVTGGGTVSLAAANTYGPSAGTVGTTLAGSTLLVGNNHSLGLGDLGITGNSTLTAGTAGLNIANNVAIPALASLSVNGSGLALGGSISGGGSLTTAGSVSLGANNTYTGGTIIGGVMSIAADGVTPGGPGSLGEVPATAQANNVLLVGGDLLATANVTLSTNRGVGVGAVSPLNTATTTALLDAAAGQTLTIGGVIAPAGNLGVNNLTVNSAAGSTGTVALGGANTINGTNIIVAGTELLENPLALQDCLLLYTLPDGKLDFGQLTNATLGGLIGSENLTLTNDSLAPVALTLGYSTGPSVYAGFLADAGLGGSLTMNGPGSQQIGAGSSGGATYQGGTTLNQGVLVLGGHTAANGPLNLTGLNGVCNLTLQDSAFLTTTNTVYLASAGGVTYPGVCTLTLLGNSVLDAAAFSFGEGSRVPGGCFLLLTNNAFLNVAGDFELESAEGSTAQNNVVNLNGGTLGVGNFTLAYGGATHQATFNFNGGVLLATTNDPSGSQWLPNLSGLTVNITNASVPAYINSSVYNITVADPLVGGSDDGLVKLGSGALYLTAANNYTGPTIVSNGSLYISQSVNNSSENFFVNDGQTFGALFDGSDTPQIGNLTLGNSAGSTTLAFTNLSSTTAAAFAAQAVALNGPCTVQIQDALNLTAGDEYPLVHYSSITTNSGSGFNLSLPRGVKATLTNDTAIPALALVVTSISVVPVFSAPVVAGNNLVLSATGGTPGHSVSVLANSSLTQPVTSWTTVATGTFDGNGDFSYTVTGALNSGQPAQFYILATQ